MIPVLIVEDDPMVAVFNQRYVEQIPGFRVAATARDGAEALSLLKTQEIRLILLDIYMPGMNGLEFLHACRTAGHPADVIVISAASDSASIRQALLQGAADYIIKPFAFSRFAAALTQYRESHKFLAGQEVLSQEELDARILYKPAAESPIPKGLDRHTLENVCGAVRAMKGLFTTEELAQEVGISRVSARKYLEFLRQRDVLRLDVCYGSVGRPTYKYRCLDKQFELA